MSRVCQITGKSVISGNSVSHSNHKTRRVFRPNLQVKKFYMPEEDRWIILKVSSAGIRTISKLGLKKALEKAQAAGLIGRV
jgi:large subunit ribosomal protein L28